MSFGVGEAIEIAKVAAEAVASLAPFVVRWITGDKSEPVRRVMDVLPEEQRTRAELLRQRVLAAADARAASRT
ncbi:MAG: hypothetical protein AB7T06_39550 [Kofleriaceae bacterium]